GSALAGAIRDQSTDVDEVRKAIDGWQPGLERELGDGAARRDGDRTGPNHQSIGWPARGAPQCRRDILRCSHAEGPALHPQDLGSRVDLGARERASRIVRGARVPDESDARKRWNDVLQQLQALCPELRARAGADPRDVAAGSAEAGHRADTDRVAEIRKHD